VTAEEGFQVRSEAVDLMRKVLKMCEEFKSSDAYQKLEEWNAQKKSKKDQLEKI